MPAAPPRPDDRDPWPGSRSDRWPEWRAAPEPVPYRVALAAMEARAAAIADARGAAGGNGPPGGAARELVWLLEHPAVYTAGTSADPAELIDPRFPVVAAGRGGRYTYHGPGQRVGYVLLDLDARGRDVRRFVHALEAWVIDALAILGVEAFAVAGRVGIWTIDGDGREAKIGAIGVRVRRWVTTHGFSVNVSPDLADFGGIVPCGLAEHPVTSLAALGHDAGLAALDGALALSAPRFLETFS